MEKTYSVSEINNLILELLDKVPLLKKLQIEGEISNYKAYPSGHHYFTLKDGESTLKCVMFKYAAQGLTFKPKNGDTVVARGNIKVFIRDGLYQLYVEEMKPQGQGDLMIAYEKLKAKLKAEGLFEESRKQPLPVNPKTVGIITSSAGAAVRDIITVSRRRNKGIQLILYPVRVQGTEASGEIVRAIKYFNQQQPVEVLIVGRGGGSIEDLWAFNEEPTVRAVAGSKIPVISAVGHETDFTLCDFAADRRAATPSQAAEMAVADRESYKQRVEYLQQRAEGLLLGQLQQLEARTQRLSESWALREPHRLFENQEQRLDMALEKLDHNLEKRLENAEHSFQLQLTKLEGLSPLAVLARGYSVTRKVEGEIVSTVKQLDEGPLFQQLTTELADGIIYSTVDRVERKDL